MVMRRPQARSRIEEVFAWVKTIAGFAKTRHRGIDSVRWTCAFAVAADNLIHLPKLLDVSTSTPGVYPTIPANPWTKQKTRQSHLSGLTHPAYGTKNHAPKPNISGAC